MDFYADAEIAFNRMRETAQAVFADPSNREKIKAAQEAAAAYKELHRQAAESAGLPEVR
jgi:3-dehydroquinate synthase class II